MILWVLLKAAWYRKTLPYVVQFSRTSEQQCCRCMTVGSYLCKPQLRTIGLGESLQRKNEPNVKLQRKFLKIVEFEENT